MTDPARLLGHPGDDPGCDACFRVMDEIAEAPGEIIAERFPEAAAHLRDCAACREDLEGLVDALTR